MLPEMLVICHHNYLENLCTLVSEEAENVCAIDNVVVQALSVDEKFNNLKTLKCM